MPRRYLPVMKMRDMNFIKPAKYRNHVTISELGKIVGKDISWIRKLERAEKIPRAARVQRGELSIRLWSPAQVDEIKRVFENMQVGRPPGG